MKKGATDGTLAFGSDILAALKRTREELAKAEGRIADLERALRDFEWCDEDTILSVGRCPACGNLELFGHASDCAFVALLNDGGGRQSGCPHPHEEQTA
jgi:hypothetical protein